MLRGHGCPHNALKTLRGHCPLLTWLHALAISFICCSSVGAEEEATVDPASSVHCELRFVWGSTLPRTFAGTISLETGTIRQVRNLSLQADSIGKVRSKSASELEILPHSPATFGGLDLSVNAPKDTRVTVSSQNPISGEIVRHDATVQELLAGTWIKPLDKEGARIAFERQVYDRIRVDVGRDQTIFRPGESLAIKITGNHTGLDPGAYVLSVGYEAQKPLSTQRVVVDAAGSFPVVQVPVAAPRTDGAHLLTVSLSHDHLLSSVIASSAVLLRRLDIVVVDDRATPTGIVGWKPLAEIDAYQASQPGSLAWLAPEEVRKALPIQTVSDVASKWNYINPLAGSLTTPETFGELGSRTVIDTASESSQSAQCLTLASRASVTFPLGKLKPGVPHRLSVTYPTDNPMHLAVTIRPRSGNGRQSVDSAIRLEPIACSETGDVTRHEVLFWPDEGTSTVTFYNPHPSWDAAIKTVLVSAAENGPTTANASSQRHTGVYLSQPILVDAMAAQRDPDPSIGRRYEGWRTWHTALERLGQYMSWMEADTLFVNVLSSGGGILVNDTLTPTLRFDSGPFFSDSRSPHQKDVVELLLRLADRDKRHVVLLLNIDSILADLAALPDERSPDSLYQKNVRSDPVKSQAQQYNPLHESVQASLRRAIAEVMSRYGNHGSLAGVGLQLGRKSQFVFRGDTWGYSPGNVTAFEKHAGGKLSTAVSMEEVFRQDSIRASFLSWRANQLTEFFQELTATVRSGKSDAKLYINLSRLWASPPTAEDFFDPQGALRSPGNLLLSCGVDATQLAAIDGLELISGGRPRGDDSVNSADWMLDLASQQCLAVLPAKDQATCIVQTPSTSIEVSSSEGQPTQIYPALTASGRFALKDLVGAIYQSDRTQITTGSWAPRQGDVHWQRELFSTLRALPPVPMMTTEEQTATNVRVRTVTHMGKTYFQIINNASWSETVSLTVQYPAQASVRELGLGPSRLVLESSRPRVLNTWAIQLRPFDVAAVEVGSEDVVLLGIDYTSPEEALRYVASELAGVETVVSRAGDPTQQSPMVDLGGDFERWSAEERPLGWTLSSLPQVSLAQSTELPRSGRSSLMVTNRGRSNTSAWIQSRPIVPPRTGRLLVSAWLRVSAASEPALVRLSVSGRLDSGETFERWALVGGLSPDQKRLPIDWGRRPFQLHVSDMPLDQLKSMRVGVELIGSGKVWIDDVEVYELQLMPHEWRHLQGQILVARDRLAEGNPYPAYKLLESHWGQYASRLSHAPEPAMTPAQADAFERSASGWNNSTPVFEKWRESLRQRWSK